MSHHTAGKLFFIALLSSLITTNAFADDNPCNGLLNLVDRPSNLDSACAVPFKQVMVEMGYQYTQLYHPNGEQQSLPNAEVRIGLPASNELAIQVPRYIHQNITPHYGNTATVVALKHEIGYNQTWLGAVEAVVTLPQGSSAFGSNGVGTAINGIVGYDVSPKINMTFMLGVSSLTTSSLSGGQRYTSVNPDLVLTYSPSNKVNVYGEVFAQSKTGPGQNTGVNADAGVLYAITANWEVDFEVGQRISGSLNSLNHYVGTGTAILF